MERIKEKALNWWLKQYGIFVGIMAVMGVYIAYRAVSDDQPTYNYYILIPIAISIILIIGSIFHYKKAIKSGAIEPFFKN